MRLKLKSPMSQVVYETRKDGHKMDVALHGEWEDGTPAIGFARIVGEKVSWFNYKIGEDAYLANPERVDPVFLDMMEMFLARRKYDI